MMTTVLNGGQRQKSGRYWKCERVHRCEVQWMDEQTKSEKPWRKSFGEKNKDMGLTELVLDMKLKRRGNYSKWRRAMHVCLSPHYLSEKQNAKYPQTIGKNAVSLIQKPKLRPGGRLGNFADRDQWSTFWVWNFEVLYFFGYWLQLLYFLGSVKKCCILKGFRFFVVFFWVQILVFNNNLPFGINLMLKFCKVAKENLIDLSRVA